jgi:glycosyltransferase involved in cell wall biosynthesis
MGAGVLMPELVSILIPAYNAEAWLPTAIRSALAQTWPRTEIIVVDDGSKDGTLAAAKAFENASVKVISQPNAGAPAARNTALQFAQGTYIQWLDADDFLDQNKISAQMKVAEKVADRHVLLAGPFASFYYRPEKAVFVPTPLWCDLLPIEYFVTRFAENAYFQTDTWLVSRELTEAVGPWTDQYFADDDGEYFCRVVMKSTSVKFVENARTYYRIANVSSLAKGRSAHAQTSLYRSRAQCIEYLLALEDSPRTRAACVRLLQDSLVYFYPERNDLIAEARQLADHLGGALLQDPVLKWKYRPLEWLFGYNAAMKATRVLPRFRAQIAGEWDRLLFRMSGGVPGVSA